MGYTPEFPNTGVELPTPQTVLRPGGRDGFEEYYFEGADAQTTFRSPQTLHTPQPPNTPPTPHGSTSRGVTGGHDSNASDFQESSLPSSDEKGKSLGLGKSTTRVLVSIGRIWIIRGPGLVIFPMRLFCRCFRISRQYIKYKLLWNSLENSNIFDAFKCVLKDRYRDRMKHIRIKSGDMTRNDGKPVPHVIVPTTKGCITIAPCAYRRMCGHHWSTDKWRKNSKIAQQNRKVADANGSTARHTAGSIGFDEHRNNLEVYLHEMVKKYGEDSSNHKDDAEVWEETQLRRKGKKKGDIYGIGASDIHFVISGTSSSQSTQSDSTQQEVDRLRAQLSTMEQQQQQMKEQMEMVMRMMNMSGNQPRNPPDNPPEDN
ncbi:unnamed protein product [Lactuca saligna]|uniref:Uncharacterized protein n=1 Tax=Lactuca saligna TaxID=75948 RepID=A0AA36E772_LACSI|nr:unnamed protein product [Lactuca saligna]